MTEKVVRGFTYAQDRKFIEPPYRVTFFPPDRAAHFLDALDQFGETYDRAPGIVIRHVLAEDDRMSALFEIELWQQFKMYASVDRQH